ncbi:MULTISPECIES: hypothetical protein [Legionella]|uniref:Uncharacterized protein n=1 Tax=Legionella resiliens TaxID=2905958 RepID=A0ABS8X0Y2_9GAMM|nr:MULTISPECIES: hypothetical protein [unclassified Legionella]MCE0723245.1 hypothetical protein [Legionella sp. 9fVS26]MCE3532398.1 hypothetical protein [Legionella sp. 8cVS16]QLZ68538.1 hypothetical protein FOLKNPGA_01317 [Legionella sp. PC1000]
MKKIMIIIGLCLLGSSFVYAEQTIRITVTTNDQNAAGIGYLVNGKKIGGPGKSYTGKGPKNGKYLFGYRIKSAQGRDVSCGSHKLTRDSYVILLAKKNKCRSIVRR